MREYIHNSVNEFSQTSETPMCAVSDTHWAIESTAQAFTFCEEGSAQQWDVYRMTMMSIA